MEYLEIDSSPCKPCNPDSELLPSSSSADHQPLMSVSNISHKRKAGRKKFNETRHPIFRGVRQRRGNKWVSEIREPCKKSRIWLGTFISPEMAARAYDVAVLALRGKSAALNFPDSASILPRAKSSSPKDIQIAALAAAKAFKPTKSTCCSGISYEKNKVSDHNWNLEIGNCNDCEWNYGFMDEEALFNMPGLLESMAEGLLLTSPALQTQVLDWDDDVAASTINVDIWGHYL